MLSARLRAAAAGPAARAAASRVRTSLARSFHATAPRATTIVAVRKDGMVSVVGDGQVSLGNTIVKPNASKVRRLGNDGEIVAGFAGSTADALALMERLESKLEQYPNQLTRACVELSKAWRTDKYLRRLDALLLVANSEQIFTLTGNGDVLEPSDGVDAIGSGGAYALAAARAMIDRDDLSAEDIAKKSLNIAASICVYTNDVAVVESIPKDAGDAEVQEDTEAGQQEEATGPKAKGGKKGGK